MKGIKGFFEKFNNKASKQVAQYMAVSNSVKDNTGIEIEMKDISISDGTVKIKSSQALKNEIYIKKQKILSDIKKYQLDTPITDIN